jgi:hypothetical protein
VHSSENEKRLNPHPPKALRIGGDMHYLLLTIYRAELATRKAFPELTQKTEWDFHWLDTYKVLFGFLNASMQKRALLRLERNQYVARLEAGHPFKDRIRITARGLTALRAANY